MNEQQTQTIETLNRLYAAECRSLLPRLAEAGVFVSWASAGEMAIVQRMVVEEREHTAWLVAALDACRGALYPAGPDVHTGQLHYLDLEVLLPRVVRSLEDLVQAYQEAGRQRLIAPADDVVYRILARHHAHLEQLKQMRDRAAGGV